MFDVSHMGRFRFKGRDARSFLDHVCTRQIHGMQDGQVRYSLICNERGGVRDDVLVYRIDDAEYLMVCNASNREKLLEHFDEVRGDRVFSFKDETESTAMVAIQGPNVIPTLTRTSSSIGELRKYRFVTKNMLIATVLISRTGYTGEDGIEVIFPASFAKKALDLVMQNIGTGEDAVVKPAGLGARDSLRLEAGMALYGHELTEDIDPVSAGLHFAIKYGKGSDDPSIGRFIGQDVIDDLKRNGTPRRLVGLTLDGRRAARQNMIVRHDGEEIGVVTSGCLSPTLDRSIAMAYVDVAHADEGSTVDVDFVSRTAPATVTALPFYSTP